jgi:hypothetical protein
VCNARAVLLRPGLFAAATVAVQAPVAANLAAPTSV